MHLSQRPCNRTGLKMLGSVKNVQLLDIWIKGCMKRKKVTDIDGECQEHGKFKLKGGVLNNLNGFSYNRVIYLLNVTLNCTQKI